MQNILFGLIALTLFTSPVIADSGQYGQYGGTTPVEQIVVDKKVSRGVMTKGGVMQYVDNFSPTDTRFIPGQKVYFQIKIKNISNAPLENISVVDTMPSYLDAAEGPGSYDTTNRTISWNYKTLKPGEEKTEHITAIILSQQQLPTDKGVICLTNTVKAHVSKTVDDSSQFCIEKQVSLTKGGIPTKSPEAGPELGIVVGAINLAALCAGIYIRKQQSHT